MNAFLIITFGQKNLIECINSIRQFYPDILICIVNNNLKETFVLPSSIKNVLSANNTGNNYELGAIWHATKLWSDRVDKFGIIHNSILITDKFPDIVWELEYLPFWTADIRAYAPVIRWVEQKLNVEIRNPTWKSVSGCMCFINTSILMELEEYHSVYATQKTEAVGTEVLFGYLMHHVLGKTQEPMHPGTINDCWTKKYESNLNKIISGQGGAFSNSDLVNFNNTDFPMKFTRNIDIDVNAILKYVENKPELIKKIIDTGATPLVINRNRHAGHALQIARHKLCIKKYFPDLE